MLLAITAGEEMEKGMYYVMDGWMDRTVVTMVSSACVFLLDGGKSRVTLAHMGTPGPGLTRQQRGGNDEVAQLAPLVTTGTSLVPCGKISVDKSEGRKEGQMDSVTEIYPSCKGEYRKQPENS